MPKYRDNQFELDSDALMDAIQAEKKKVIENINDRRSDPKAKRHIVIDIAFTPDPNSGAITIGSTIVSKIAPVSISALASGVVQLTIDDVVSEDDDNDHQRD